MNLISLGAKPEIKCAELELDERTKVLFSYGRPVAALLPVKGYVRLDEAASKTTERHIVEWLGSAPVAELVTQQCLDRLLLRTQAIA